MNITIICKQCGEEFEDYECNHRKFCCKKCLNEWQIGRPMPNRKTGIYMKCKECGKRFYIQKNEQKRKPKYCSKACADKGRVGMLIIGKMKECNICGKEFVVMPCIEKRGKGKYCSKECAAKGISKTMTGRKMPRDVVEKARKSREKYYDKKGRITTHKRIIFLNRRRRTRTINAEGSHTFGEWELLKKQYGYTCLACKRKEPEIKLTKDHIIPISRGGSDYVENLQPLCGSCNSKKHTRIIKYKY